MGLSQRFQQHYQCPWHSSKDNEVDWEIYRSRRCRHTVRSRSCRIAVGCGEIYSEGLSRFLIAGTTANGSGIRKWHGEVRCCSWRCGDHIQPTRAIRYLRHTISRGQNQDYRRNETMHGRIIHICVVISCKGETLLWADQC